MADFLFEIGLEEIPARMIAGAEVELGKRITDLLTRERLLGPADNVTTFSTPRRLAILVQDLPAAQADAEEKLTGPSWKVAFKDGAAFFDFHQLETEGFRYAGAACLSHHGAQLLQTREIRSDFRSQVHPIRPLLSRRPPGG